MKIIWNFIIIICLLSFNILCDCKEASINEMYEANEFVFIAEPIENIHPEKETKVMLDSRMRGINVSMKVKKILKGDIQFDSLIVYQGDGCLMDFRFGKSYIVFGNQINNFQVVKRDVNIIVEDGEDIFLEESELENGVFSIYNGENWIIEFWNKQARNNTIVETSLCRVGEENGKLYNLLLNIE